MWSTRVAPLKNSHGSPTIYIQADERTVVLPGVSTVAFNPDFDKKDLTVAINLQPEQQAYLETVDKWALAEALKNSLAWFGKAHTEAELAAMYTPCVKTHETYAPKFKARVTPRTRLTLEGRDVPFEEAKAIQRGSAVQVGVDFARVWVVGNRWGIVCYYTNMLMTRPAQQYPPLPEA